MDDRIVPSFTVNDTYLTVHTGQATNLVPDATDYVPGSFTVGGGMYSGPEHGSITSTTADGITSYAYTSTSGYLGTEVIPFTVSSGDPDNLPTINYFTITTTNAAPTATNYDIYAHVNNTVAITPTFGDPDDDTTTLELTSVTHGTAEYYAETGVITFVPNNNYLGDALIEYAVTDAFGATATGTITVHLQNQSPTPLNYSITANAGNTVVIMPDMYTDPDNDALTLASTSTPTNGAVSFDSWGVITFVPNAGFKGTETMHYTLADDFGGSGTGAITLTFVNNAPVLPTSLSYTTDEDTPVLDEIAGNDADSDALSLVVVTEPAHGTLEVDGLVFQYTPDADWHGTDTFVLKAFDGTDYSANMAVSVVVNSVNDAPRPTETSEFDTDEDTSVTIGIAGLVAKFADPESDTVSYSGFEQPQNGTVEKVGNDLIYTPDADFAGTDYFVVKMTDGAADDDSSIGYGYVFINVAPVNDPAVAVDDEATTFENLPFDIYPLNNDTDAEGAVLEITSFTQPTYGAVTLTDGVFRFTPNTDFTGDDSFQYTMGDGVGGSSTASIAIHVINAPSNGNRVWIDENGNGLMDADEPGLAGFTVELHDLTDSVIVGTTTTDSDGVYSILGSYDLAMDHDYQIRFVNPDTDKYGFTTKDAGAPICSSSAEVDGLTPVFQVGAEVPAKAAGVKGKRQIMITDVKDDMYDMKLLDDGKRMYLKDDYSDNASGTVFVNRKGLSVASWDNAFTRKKNGGIEVAKPDGAGLDFIDKDEDRFYVKVYDLDLWNAKGADYRRWILASVSTDNTIEHLFDEEYDNFSGYNDDATLIPLARDPKHIGWFTSDSQILVSTFADDEEKDAFGNHMGDDNAEPATSGIGETPAGPIPADEYVKGGLRFPSSDRTHLVALGGTLKAEYATGDPQEGFNGTIDATTPVPIDKVVKLHVNILRLTAGGEEVMSQEDMQNYISWANDIFASARIRIRLAEPMQIVDPPTGVTLDDAVGSKGLDVNFSKDDDTASGEMKPEEKALLDANLLSAATDDIEVYVVNAIPGAAGVAYMAGSAYADRTIVTAGMPNRTLAHELLHILGQADHLKGKEGTNQSNLMAVPRTIEDLVTDSRRINKAQAAAALEKRPALLTNP